MQKQQQEGHDSNHYEPVSHLKYTMNTRSWEQVPSILTMKEAMDILQVGRKSIMRLIDNGEIKACLFGKGYLIDKKSLEVWFESKSYQNLSLSSKREYTKWCKRFSCNEGGK